MEKQSLLVDGLTLYVEYSYGVEIAWKEEMMNELMNVRRVGRRSGRTDKCSGWDEQKGRFEEKLFSCKLQVSVSLLFFSFVRPNTFQSFSMGEGRGEGKGEGWERGQAVFQHQKIS